MFDLEKAPGVRRVVEEAMVQFVPRMVFAMRLGDYPAGIVHRFATWEEAVAKAKELEAARPKPAAVPA